MTRHGDCARNDRLALLVAPWTFPRIELPSSFVLQTKFQFASLQTLLPAFLVLTLFPSPARAFPPQDQQSAVAQSAPNYPNSDDGFRDQFKAVFQAECPGGSAPGKHLLEQFKIPDSAAWFARNFDPSDAPTLAERYDRLFPDYVNSVVDTIKRVCDDKGLVYVTGSKDRPAEPRAFGQGSSSAQFIPGRSCRLSCLSLHFRRRDGM